MRIKKSQISFEYLAIAGIIIITTTVLLYVFAAGYMESDKIKKAQNSVNALANAADDVYLGRAEDKKYVYINLPSGIKFASASGRQILIQLDVGGSIIDAMVITTAIVNGTLPTGQGMHKLYVEKLKSGIVLIGSLNDTSPPRIIDKSINGLLMEVTTDEYALCRYDSADITFDNMTSSFNGELTLHKTTIS